MALSPISLTTLGTAYTQNFDTLANTGTTNALTIPGWEISESLGGTRDNEQYAADTGSSATGDTYSYGTSGATERALGSLASGSLTSNYGAVFVNNTGDTITSLDIAYTGEQWREGGRTDADTLFFQYQVGATDVSAGTWTNFSSLNFDSPHIASTAGALDGNAAANQQVMSATITGLNIAPGETFAIRYMDTNALGSDDGLAVDNFSLIPHTTVDTTPPTLVSSNPADEAANVSTTSNIVLTFNESVQLGAGDITITNGTDTRVITVGGGAADPDGAVTVSGNTVTIDPSADLNAGGTYHVTFGSGVIEDTSGNDFAGIGAGGLDFTTAATQTFSISATDANKAEGSVATTPFTFTITRANPTGDATITWTVTDIGGANQASASDFSGPMTGTVTFTGTETTKTVTLNVVGDLAVEPNETFSVTLSNGPSDSAVSTASANGTIQNDDVPLTAIYTIQGSGHLSPLAGQIVTTTGVVTAVDMNGSRGFYIQDPDGDNNAATSDGIFVFRPSGDLPAVGHLVRVSGTVQEFTPNGAAVGSFSITEISSVTNVVDLGVGPAITPTVIGGPGGLVPPTESLIEGGNFFESLEGMLVTVKDAVATGPTNSFGEIFTVVDTDSDGANGTTATGQIGRGNLLLTPGAGDFGDTNTSGGDFNPERVQIDDDNGIIGANGSMAAFSSPMVNVGARLGDVTGIVNYDFGNYQVVATQTYTVATPSALVKETGTLNGDADHLLVASYNAENLDPGDGAVRFQAIATQILHNLNAPDIVALQEIQDNSGPTDNGVTSASQTLGMIVDALNADPTRPAGAHYAFIDNPFIGNDTNGGEPGGNIRTAYIYRTDRVDFVSGSLQTIGADGSAVTTSYVDQQTNPDNPFFDSRPPLVATFIFNGEEVTVIDNHFTSKGGSAPLSGSDQPPFDAGEVRRAGQAQAVNTFVDHLLAASSDAKVIVAGDLNEFQFEEPMNVLKGTATISNYDVPGTDPFDAVADYTQGGTQVLNDLQDLLPADQRYDYVFEGNSETLDHVFVSNALQNVAQFDVVRINAEFADQTSDHDPLLASFTILANRAPVALDDTATVAEDAAVVIDVLANDTDANNDDLMVSAINGQAFDANGHVTLANGTVTLNGDGSLTFAPASNFNGPVSFDYTVTDGQLTDTGTVAVTVTPVNDAPGFTSPASFTAAENQISAGVAAAVDPEGDAFGFALAGGDDRAFFDIDANTGALRFLASPDFETPADFNHDNVYELMVSATDSHGAASTQAIAVTVTDVAEAGLTINGTNKDDKVAGGPGNDTIYLRNGNDRASGGDGNDTVFADNGNDIVSGGRGNDTLFGENGNDTLFGDVGSDRLIGGNGNDVLTGGADADTFVFGKAHGNDTVMDFSAGDVIELQGLFANFAAVHAAMQQQGSDTVIHAGGDIVLHDVQMSSLQASDFHLV